MARRYHSFSFGNYYNPEKMGFGALRVLNDDIIAPETGFDTHPHKNMEIVTIPLKGELKHGDSKMNERIITPGDIQVMSAGTGIYHSESNPHGSVNAESLQIWFCRTPAIPNPIIMITTYASCSNPMN
jgi:redox-sensitive bicupin YhaK (pirin superfamily)